MESNGMDAEGEQELVKRVGQDAEAFRALYRHYFPRVYAYVSYRVGQGQDAEDLVGETLLKALQGLGRFQWRGDGSFAAWLFRIAHNEVKSFYRQREPLALEELPPMGTDNASPEEAAIREETFAHLRGLLESLSPRRREVIALRFFGRLRNRDIAQILQLDERTVASHLSRGLKELHGKYVKGGDSYAQAK